MKHHDHRKQVGEERAYWAYTVLLQCVTEGSQNRRVGTWSPELMWNLWGGGVVVVGGGVLLIGFPPVVHSTCLLIRPKTSCQGTEPPQMA